MLARLYRVLLKPSTVNKKTNQKQASLLTVTDLKTACVLRHRYTDEATRLWYSSRSCCQYRHLTKTDGSPMYFSTDRLNYKGQLHLWKKWSHFIISSGCESVLSLIHFWSFSFPVSCISDVKFWFPAVCFQCLPLPLSNLPQMKIKCYISRSHVSQRCSFQTYIYHIWCQSC